MNNNDPPDGGRIRPGFRVLTRAASENPEVMAIYEAGRRKQWSTAKIEAAIKKSVPDFTRTAFMPVNTPYFRVERDDFPDPRTANRIIRLYGEEDHDRTMEEGSNKVMWRLYRFPVMFYAEREQVLHHHSLRCWAGGGLKYWADLGQDGIMRCMQYAAPKQKADGKGVVRVYHGRAAVPRDWNAGVCDPEKCPEFQSKSCSESWTVQFYIPGIKGIRPIKMDTHGFYGMDDAAKVLDQVCQTPRQTITGLQDGEPIFWFSKTQRKVSMIDPETGCSKRVMQWVITLDAELDVCAVYEAQRLALPNAVRAVALLQGDSSVTDDSHGELVE